MRTILFLATLISCTTQNPVTDAARRGPTCDALSFDLACDNDADCYVGCPDNVSATYVCAYKQVAVFTQPPVYASGWFCATQ